MRSKSRNGESKTVQRPPMKNYGGIRSITSRMMNSTTLIKNREAVAYALLSIANTKITDVMQWDEAGNVKVLSSSKIDENALHAIKSIKCNTRTFPDGGQSSTLEVELVDKVAILRLLAKAAGFLDNAEDTGKPSVIGINIRAPEIVEQNS